MKQILKKIGILSFPVFIIQIMMCVCLASELTEVPFAYNILPVLKENSVIDGNVTSTLGFHLFEESSDIYYLGELIPVTDQYFEIDISELSGKTILQFSNSMGETKEFPYYISNEEGKIENYELIKGYFFDVYVETYRNMKIIYTDREKAIIPNMKEYLAILPENYIQNVDTIKLIPFENTKNIAGVTKENFITLYKFSKYDPRTQKNVLFHEIGHTFANKMMTKQIIDYSYTNYTNAALLDQKSVSHYATKFTEENNRYSEDFAESMAFYFISSTFDKQYPNRAKYIRELLELPMV